MGLTWGPIGIPESTVPRIFQELSVSRSTWLAIRSPLTSRRATTVKLASFLLPLGIWALITSLWLPDVYITAQGDTPAKPDQTVQWKTFQETNAEVKNKPPQYRLTDKSLEAMKAAGVPASVLEKLKPVKWTEGSAPYNDRDNFFEAVRGDGALDLNPKEEMEWGEKIWASLEGGPRKPAQGYRSSPYWLPAPHKVARAFYTAFVTPPAGAGFRLTDESMASLRKEGVPEAVLSRLKPLEGKFFPYGDEHKFVEQVAKDLGVDEAKQNSEEKKESSPSGKIAGDDLKRYPKQILKHVVYAQKADREPWLHESLWHSCQIIFWGFLFSAIVGVPLGILCGTFDLFAKLTEPFIDFIRYMPAPAFGILCLAVLGLADGPKIAIIWIGTFFQMVLVVANTTRQFDESLLEAAQTLGASKTALLTKVILPGILPALYNDMRILLGWAWTYLIVAELIGASSGISYFINHQGKYGHFDNVYAGIIMIGLIGLTCDQILAAFARVLFPWTPKKERGTGAWGAFFGAITFLPRLLLGKAAAPQHIT
jgi:NitT/TauT family transport system permease protein